MRRTLATTAGLALTAALITPTAHAAPAKPATHAGQASHAAPAAPTAIAAASATCWVEAGAATTGRDYTDRFVHSTSPITVEPDHQIAEQPYGDLVVRLNSDMVWDRDTAIETLTGSVVFGAALYDSRIRIDRVSGNGAIKETTLTRIGGGWDRFRTLTRSNVTAGDPGFDRSYALRDDGVLFRWFVQPVNGRTVWKAAGSHPGFAAVKAVALLSRTSTYDTLLVNTRGGALYTVRIPLASPMRPIVKPVRTRTWQGFESLNVNRCGQYGSLLLGIDKDTKAGYLYAVGHANGTATVINSLGKVPATFAEPVDFRWSSYYDAPPFGE
ncbi:hypothetical protein [Kribbella sp. CA-247076]|uniref:hypothetical protein n=1 Tax=Kribbella sp. CA-247076 TaxID=3239941 RepID=UPI003D917D43